MGPLVRRPTHGREHNKKRPYHSKDHSHSHVTSPLSSKGDKVNSVRKLFPATNLAELSSNQKSPGNSGHMTPPLSKPRSILTSPELKVARSSSGTLSSPPSHTSTTTHRTPPNPSSNKPPAAKSQPLSASLPHTDKSQPSLNSKLHLTHNNKHLLLMVTHDAQPNHAHESKHNHAHKVTHDAQQLPCAHDTKFLHDRKVRRERAVSDPGQNPFVGKGKAPHGKRRHKFKHQLNWHGLSLFTSPPTVDVSSQLQSHPFTSKHNGSSASLTDTVIPPEPDSPMDTAAFQPSSTTSRSDQTPNDMPFIPTNHPVHSSPPGCSVGLLCRLQPHFCQIPSCNLETVQPFGKFVKGWLGNYADGLETNVGSVQNYLGLLQEIILHGSHIPSEELSTLLEHVLKLSKEEDIKKVNYLLQQDLLLQEKIDVSGETLWTIIEKCLETLEESHSSAVSRLRSEVVLSYVFGLLFKDLNGKTGEPGDSLVEKMLSLRNKWSNLTKLLHLLCSTIERESEKDLLDLLMSLVSLPLLTCRQLDRRELATRLAREISNRLGGLSSTEKKRQLLLSIPSDYLRERVIRIHLKTNFVLHSSITQDPESYHEDDVSLSHISQVHLNRVPYSRNGVLDLTYFLMLLCYLIQSHVRCLQGVPILTYLGDDVPTQWRNFPLMSEEELQVSLLSLSPQVLSLSERLTMDETLLTALTSGENWMYLQLLQSLTGL